MMTAGQKVSVYPHGKPAEAAAGSVVIISANQRSIAVAFEDKPPFCICKDGFTMHPQFGIIMLAMRESVGPWIEMVGGGHYEIEARREQ